MSVWLAVAVGLFFSMVGLVFVALFALTVYMWVGLLHLRDWLLSDGWYTFALVLVSAWIAYEIVFSDFAI